MGVLSTMRADEVMNEETVSATGCRQVHLMLLGSSHLNAFQHYLLRSTLCRSQCTWCSCCLKHFNTNSRRSPGCDVKFRVLYGEAPIRCYCSIHAWTSHMLEVSLT